jgi:hypothetical protein
MDTTTILIIIVILFAYRRGLVRPRTVVLGWDFTYIDGMLWRVRNSRGRPMNAPAAFIHRVSQSSPTSHSTKTGPL